MTLFSSNFVLISICKFFKTSNCTCTWKIRSPYLHQIAWEIILLPVNNLHEKHIRVSWDKILAVCYLQFALVLQLCTIAKTLHSRYKFAFVLHEKCSLNVHNFFMYIISRITALLFNLSTCFLFIYRMQTGIQLTCTGLWKK